MGRRRIATIALSGVLIAGGGGAALAAVTKDNGKKAEQAVLDDAAKRLDVTPEKLRDALSAAQDAQLDQAVKDGDLTQKQADAIKAARAKSGRVLGPLGGPGLRGPDGPGGPHMRGGPGGPDRGGAGPRGGGIGGRAFGGGLFDDLAKALGTTRAKLLQSLRDGTSIADVAKANGKSLADVKSAVKAAVKSDLDAAVKDGDLTQKQADERLSHVDEAFDALASGKGPKLRLRGHGGKPPALPDPPAGAPQPGSFAPDEQGAPQPGTYS